MLGAIYSSEKKFDLAEAQFRKVIDANPERRVSSELFWLHSGGSWYPAG